MLAGRTSKDFVTKISGALSEAVCRGIYVTAGAGSCDLEAQQFSRHSPENKEPIPAGRPYHLEEPPGPRDLGNHDGCDRQPLRPPILAHAAGEPTYRGAGRDPTPQH